MGRDPDSGWDREKERRDEASAERAAPTTLAVTPAAPTTLSVTIVTGPRLAAAQQANSCLTKAGEMVEVLTRLQAAIAKGDWPRVARLAEAADRGAQNLSGYAYALKAQAVHIEHLEAQP